MVKTFVFEIMGYFYFWKKFNGVFKNKTIYLFEKRGIFNKKY